MGAISKKMEVDVQYFGIGTIIEHSWFVGEVIGINAPRLMMWVRVTRVKHPAEGRSIGSTKVVPFNQGREVGMQSFNQPRR